MFKKHAVKAGETLQSIAQKYYYNTSKYINIKQANNLTSNILSVGQILIIPDQENNNNEPYKFETIGIVIDNQKYELWQDLQIQFDLDRLAPSFSFSSPYEPAEPYLQSFEPFGFQDIKIYYKNSLIITGTLINTQYENSDSNIVSISGYGKAGILQNVTLPTSLFPRQLRNISLKEISEKYCKPFGISVDNSTEANAPMRKKFIKTEIDPTQKISSFLISLAKERGLITSTNNEGKLFFSFEHTSGGNAVFDIQPGDYNLSASYNSENIFSDVTALTTANRNQKSKIATKKIDVDIFRHHTISYNSNDDGNMNDFINSEIGRILINSISISFQLPFWENRNKKLFNVGEIITIKEPRVRIEKTIEFVIKSITYSLSESGKTAAIEVVPKSSLNNIFEKFWIQYD